MRCLCLFFILSAIVGCEKSGPPVLVRWNEHKITQADLDQEMQRAQYQELKSAESAEMVQAFALEALLSRALFLEAARDEKLDEIPEVREQSEKALAQIKGDRELFKKFLEAGETEESFARKYFDDYLIDQYQLRVARETTVSASEVQETYDRFVTAAQEDPEAVRIRHIFMQAPGLVCTELEHSARMKAWETYSLLQKPDAEFSVIARNLSEMGDKLMGGYFGIMKRGEQEPEIEEVVFKMKKDEISKPIKTLRGFQIVQVLERIPPPVEPLEQVESLIRQRLYEEKADRLIEAKLQELVKQKKVEFLS